MRRNRSSGNPIRKCGKAIGPVASRIARRGKRAANRGRRNDGSKSTIPNPPKIPPCNCGGTTFALVGSDGAMVYVAVKCQSCGEQRVLHVRGRKVTVLRKLD
jgi:hypothetical protein